MTVNEFINSYVDKLKTGQHFQARTIARAYYAQEFRTKRKPKLPYSDTVQRYLRQRRTEKGDVNYFDKSKSIWWKNDHVASEEERECSRKKT